MLAAALIAATAPPGIAGAALGNSVPVVQAGPDGSAIVGQAFTQGGFPVTVYQTDFSGAVDPVWSVTTKSVTPNGQPFLGEFGQKTVTLDLGNLPAHGTVTISADVYIIRTWDGNLAFLAGIGIIGPDFFDLNVAGGQTLLHTTFSNIDNTVGFQQAYPDSIPAGVTDPAAFPSHPARTGAFAVQTLGYDLDTTYRLTYTIPHAAGSIAFNFVGAPAQDITDESWGLGRVQVSVSTPGPFFVDPDVNTWTGTVNYGDGTGTQPLALNPDKTFGLSHTYGHAGTYTATATVSDNAGGIGTGTMAVTVKKAGTSTALASSLNLSVLGQSVTLTATVSPSTATGTVQFKDGGVDLGAPVALANGSASLSTSSLAVGAHSITAEYSGDGDYNGGTSAALAQNVNKVSTTTALASSLNPSVFGQAVTLTATVSPSTATGTVQFKDGGVDLGAPVALANGSASLSTSSLRVGVHSITAVYSGDGTFKGSTSAALTQTVRSRYNFGGFLQPIPTPISSFKAGSTIPVKFQLTDASGNPVGTAVATVSAGSVSGQARYDAASQQYIYNLSTKGMLTGSLTVTVTLDDGAVHSVVVTLK